MKTALISSSNGAGAPALAKDLESVGLQSIALSGSLSFVQDAIKNQADIVVCFELIPDAAFFECMASLNRLSPMPVVVFTSDIDAEKISTATRSSIHAYVVNGYNLNRLRSILHLARARFENDRTIRQELADISQRFAERKLVDRAKGILMGARQLREEEAFRALRSAAMASKQRIGQLSQMVINAAQFAEAMNRAGQLRMLSQRLVKLYALLCAAVAPEQTGRLFADSVAHVDNNLALLTRSLSKPTHGDLIDSVAAPWARLRPALQGPPQAGRLGEVDELAEEMLRRAERLTSNLEVAAYATALRVINVSGRQRMLSQRLAKEALLGAAFVSMVQKPASRSTATEFAQGMAYLAVLPLTNDKVAGELRAAAAVDEAFQVSLAQATTPKGRAAIARLSETLLGHLDRLTDELERAMQVLVGE